MGNRITRTVLFAASALLSISAFGAGAARFGTLRNSDWVVTNAWQAVSNKTHDLILEIGHGDSLPPDWQNVSNAAVNAVQSLQPAYDYTDNIALGIIRESTNAAVAVADSKISTNNEAFISAVLAAPLVGADPNDLSEIAEYGSYGTVGAALLALIAGLAALKRRMTFAETDITGKLDGAAAYPAWNPNIGYEGDGVIVSYAGRLWENYATSNFGDKPTEHPECFSEKTIGELKQDALTPAQIGYINDVPNKANASDVATALAQKASLTDLPYAMVTPGEWEFSGEGYDPSKTYRVRFSEASEFVYAFIEVYDPVNDSWEIAASPLTDVSGTELSLSWDDGYITATRASLPGHLCDRSGNRVVVSGDTTLTLPAANPGYLRDFLVRLEISGSTVPTITFAAPTGETIVYETDGDEFPVPDEVGTWSYSFTENCVAHKFAVSLKKVNAVTQGGS